jgi:DNA adenine methylase
MNYPLFVELHVYRYLGDDFRERERITKITNNWVAKLKKKPVLERNALLSAMNSLNEMD